MEENVNGNCGCNDSAGCKKRYCENLNGDCPEGYDCNGCLFNNGSRDGN